MRGKLKRWFYKQTVIDPWKDEFVRSLEATTFISTIGLANQCTHFGTFDVDFDYSPWSSEDLFGLESMFIRPTAVQRFVQCLENRELILDNLRHLIISNGTVDFDDSMLGWCDRLLAHTGAKKIFVTNLVAKSSNLEPIPLGLDYHSNFFKKDIFGANQRMPLTQEAILKETLADARPTMERDFLVSIDWSASSDPRGERTKALTAIPGDLIRSSKLRLHRSEVWRQHSRCIFVASPFGFGLDCHRTWEALCLGCIPIVKANPMNRIFDSLPVIEVEDWSIVDEDFLSTQLDKIKPYLSNRSKLEKGYWIEKIFGSGS